MKHIKTPQELNKVSENLNISDVSDSYSLATINLMIKRLEDIKLGIETGKNHISKQTWEDFKVLYEHQYTKHIDDFFNNYH